MGNCKYKACSLDLVRKPNEAHSNFKVRVYCDNNCRGLDKGYGYVDEPRPSWEIYLDWFYLRPKEML